MESDESYEYEEEDAAKHEELINKVLSIHKTQNLKKASRTEPTLKVSEFDLVKSATGRIEIDELSNILKSRKSRVKIKNRIQKVKKSSNTLPRPLEKPQADRIRRSVAYEKARLELDRWEAVVTSNRAAAHLTFPHNNIGKLEKKEAQNFPQMFRLKSKLEEALEKTTPEVVQYDIELDKKKEIPLTMKEMLERRKDAAKVRALMSYQMAKARRTNKIKSKKYHRLQKREKIKRKLKEFEELQKTNPEEALKKLEEIEKARAEERFSLRHKGTGNWARSQQVRAKYDKEARKVLAQQLLISRELTQKKQVEESEEEEEENEEQQPANETMGNNAWAPRTNEVAKFFDGCKEFWMKQNKEKIAQHNEEKNQNANSENAEKEENEVKHARTVLALNTEDDEDEGNLDVVMDSLRNDNLVDELNKNKQEEISEYVEIEEGGEESYDEIMVENKKQKRRKKKTKDNVKVTKEKEKKKKRKKSKTNLNGSQSTSSWKVSQVDNKMIVENMFDKLENKIEKRALKNAKTLIKQLKKTNKNEALTTEEEEKKIDLSLPQQKIKPIIDEPLMEDAGRNSVSENQGTEALKNILSSKLKKAETKGRTNIQPFAPKNKPTSLEGEAPDLITEDEKDDPEQIKLFLDAFEDASVVEEFNKNKQEEIDKDKPKSVDSYLPGWGSWAGSGVKTANKRKRRRFISKVPDKIPRKDDNKGMLIINENASKKIKEHMVSEVPFPFTTVKDFEASIRAPIGNTFVPETAFSKFIRPAVATKLGSIIQPMNKEMIFNTK